jgi:hypothetical protein
MRPVLHPGTFVFCRLPARAAVPPETIGWFREAEGLSVIVPPAAATAGGLAVEFEAAWITLTAESSLSSVGLTAAVSALLAGAGIACNVVAACHHDHLFVPADRATEAMRLLEHLH